MSPRNSHRRDRWANLARTDGSNPWSVARANRLGSAPGDRRARARRGPRRAEPGRGPHRVGRRLGGLGGWPPRRDHPPDGEPHRAAAARAGRAASGAVGGPAGRWRPRGGGGGRLGGPCAALHPLAGGGGVVRRRLVLRRRAPDAPAHADDPPARTHPAGVGWWGWAGRWRPRCSWPASSGCWVGCWRRRRRPAPRRRSARSTAWPDAGWCSCPPASWCTTCRRWARRCSSRGRRWRRWAWPWATLRRACSTSPAARWGWPSSSTSREPLPVSPRQGRRAVDLVEVGGLRFAPARPGAVLDEARRRRVGVVTPDR